ncbi:hypothetical protein GTA08_BOTSDO09340 [Neofusicoccum parvum]|uniref:Uncharacterized protein n=1 Tax=Neofusicoccum parvum TaxID=310453 RepID=A0ACB5S822_9PEZI|nr:hypothetical protein GTA08_BOTSDO09340 [Neofusicoccum parvum]
MPPATATPPPPLLSRLPRELRLQIYHHLLPDLPIPAHRPSRAGALRRDGARTSGATAVLRLGRGCGAEAQAELYARTPFRAHVSRAGVSMCCGAVAFGRDDEGEGRGLAAAVLPRVRRLDVVVAALFLAVDGAVAQARFFARMLGAGVRELRVAVEWGVGAARGMGLTVEMVRRVLEPFKELGEAGLIRPSVVEVGRVGMPRWEAGKKVDDEKEEARFEGLKDELRRALLGEAERGVGTMRICADKVGWEIETLRLVE